MRLRPVLASLVAGITGCGALLGIDSVGYDRPDTAADGSIPGDARDEDTQHGDADDDAPSMPDGRACAPSYPDAAPVARTSDTVAGEANFLGFASGLLAWAGAAQDVFTCSPTTCKADGGTTRTKVGDAGVVGLASSPSVLAIVGTTGGETCTAATGQLQCAALNATFKASRPPVIANQRVYLDTVFEGDTAPSIISCSTAAGCGSGQATKVYYPLTSRSLYLAVSATNVLWVDSAIPPHFYSCAIGGCEVSGPSTILPPPDPVLALATTANGLMVVATDAQELRACDTPPCSAWTLLTHVSATIVDLVVDEQTGSPYAFWSTVDGDVQTCNLPTCSCVRTLASGISAPNHLVAAPLSVYVSSTDQSGSIWRVPR